MKLRELIYKPEQRAKISQNMDVVKSFQKGWQTGNLDSTSDDSNATQAADSIISKPLVDINQLKPILKLILQGSALNVEQKKILSTAINGKQETELYRALKNVVDGKLPTSADNKSIQTAVDQI